MSFSYRDDGRFIQESKTPAWRLPVIIVCVLLGVAILALYLYTMCKRLEKKKSVNVKGGADLKPLVASKDEAPEASKRKLVSRTPDESAELVLEEFSVEVEAE